MNSYKPEFSIFLPVKNGGKFLQSCIESILAQRYENFELIILENQSSDGTPQLLESISATDSRIKILGSASPLSIESNWQRILDIPKKEFMTIIGHDDLWEPNFLEEIVRLIRREPEATLYHTHFKLIDSTSKIIRHCRPMPKIESASEFLAARLCEIRDSFGTGYVMPSALYERVGGIKNFKSLLYADDALWISLMLGGYKVTSDSVCFSYRLHASSMSGTPDFQDVYQALGEYLEWLVGTAKHEGDLKKISDIYLPNYLVRCAQYLYFHYAISKFSPWRRRNRGINLSSISAMTKKYSQMQSHKLSVSGLLKRACEKYSSR